MKKVDIVQPLAVQTPIAVTGDKNIPSQTATGTDTSSIAEGFLPITSDPLSSGGVAPERIDFNGMFYLSTDQRVFLQDGGFITYDATVASAIGGYPEGAILGYIDANNNFGFVESLIDNNQNNFVTTPSLIDGTNWRYIPLTNTIETIKAIYPVGSIYIGLTQTCPLASLFGTWELITGGLTLQQANSAHPVGSSIPAGLPNIKGAMKGVDDNSWSYSGAFYQAATGQTSGGTANGSRPGFDASRYNSIYGNSNTVQPPALAVNIWKRTA